jgi:hypothetical protein
MANKTFWKLFNKIVRQCWLSNTFDDGTEETESIKEDINDIQKEVLTLSKTYLTKSWVLISWGTVADQKWYDIPDTVDKVSLIKVTVDSNDYFPERIGIPEFNWLSNTNQVSDIPIFYTIDKKQVVLYPTPQTSSNPIELNSNIYATDLDTDPSSSTDENTPLEIKEWFENVIYYYALNEAFSRLEDFASADRYERKHDKLFIQYKKEVSNTTNSVVVKHDSNRRVNPNYNPTLTN